MLSTLKRYPENHPRHLFITVALIWGIVHLLTRSPELASDGFARTLLIEAGNPRNTQFGDINHFLQTPMAFYLRKIFGALGIAISAQTALVGLGWLANIVGAYFIAVAIWLRFSSLRLALLAQTLFASSLVVWVYWNGELVNGALAAAAVALYFAVQKKVRHTAVALAVSACCRIDFGLLAPGLFLLSVGRVSPKIFAKKAVLFVVVLLVCVIVILLGGGLLIGKFHSIATLKEFLLASPSENGLPFIVSVTPLRILKSLKGVVSTQFGSVHQFFTLVQGPHFASASNQVFALAAALTQLVGLAILFFTARIREKWELVAGLVLIAVPQIIFNLRFYYNSEEYHGASLIGLLWILVLILKNAKLPRMAAAWVIATVLAQLAFVILPIQTYGQSRMQADAAMTSRYQALKKTKLYAVVCDGASGLSSTEALEVIDLPLTRSADLTTLKLALRNPSVGAVLIGEKCDLWYLRAATGGARYDGFGIKTHLERDFRVRPIDFGDYYLPWVNQTNPLTWQNAKTFDIELMKGRGTHESNSP